MKNINTPHSIQIDLCLHFKTKEFQVPLNIKTLLIKDKLEDNKLTHLNKTKYCNLDFIANKKKMSLVIKLKPIRRILTSKQLN